MSNTIRVNHRNYCAFCGKEQTEIEYIVGQCNDCDPFCEEFELEEVFGEPGYIDLDEVQR